VSNQKIAVMGNVQKNATKIATLAPETVLVKLKKFVRLVSVRKIPVETENAKLSEMKTVHLAPKTALVKTENSVIRQRMSASSLPIVVHKNHALRDKNVIAASVFTSVQLIQVKSGSVMLLRTNALAVENQQVTNLKPKAVVKDVRKFKEKPTTAASAKQKRKNAAKTSNNARLTVPAGKEKGPVKNPIYKSAITTSVSVTTSAKQPEYPVKAKTKSSVARQIATDASKKQTKNVPEDKIVSMENAVYVDQVKASVKAQKSKFVKQIVQDGNPPKNVLVVVSAEKTGVEHVIASLVTNGALERMPKPVKQIARGGN